MANFLSGEINSVLDSGILEALEDLGRRLRQHGGVLGGGRIKLEREARHTNGKLPQGCKLYTGNVPYVIQPLRLSFLCTSPHTVAEELNSAVHTISRSRFLYDFAFELPGRPLEDLSAKKDDNLDGSRRAIACFCPSRFSMRKTFLHYCESHSFAVFPESTCLHDPRLRALNGLQQIANTTAARNPDVDSFPRHASHSMRLIEATPAAKLLTPSADKQFPT
ncbi:hypothetical protein CVT26_008688 [Gymnopilus dilepis]|uniref:Uncharacterized protein n=1 Tax=Gymnopilus dilepis TaxID=231916 RepID=A0A409XY22_9AGAR|nr:hypothetical protein CVT26_008688 [Gymnopilus dilepis]